MRRAAAGLFLPFLALAGGLLLAGAQAPPGGMPAPALTATRYFGLDEPREWAYEVMFDSPRVFYSPYFLGSLADLTGSSTTHGFKTAKGREITFSVRAAPIPDKDQDVPVVLDEAASQFWFGRPSVCGAKLVIVRSSSVPDGHPWKRNAVLSAFPKELLALELHVAPCSKDGKPLDWGLGEILGMAAGDWRSNVSLNGWLATAVGPVAVSAGTYPRAMYSKFPRGDGQFAPRHVVESWIAEGVGLIKYRVTQDGALVYEVRLTGVRKIKQP